MAVLVIADYSETQDVRLRYREKRRVVVWDPTDVQNDTIGIPFELYLVVVLPSMGTLFEGAKRKLRTVEVKYPSTMEEAICLVDEFLVASTPKSKELKPPPILPLEPRPSFLDRRPHRLPSVRVVAHSPPKSLPDQSIVTDPLSSPKSADATMFEKECLRLREENRILRAELERVKSQRKDSTPES